MRHRNSGRKLNRNARHSSALFSRHACALIKHEQIVTTLPKAKDLRRVADRLITLAKKGDLHARRLPLPRIRDEALVATLFGTVGPRYASRSGGYTRVMKAGFRYGDAAPMAVIEFVDRDLQQKGNDYARVHATSSQMPSTPGRCKRRPRTRGGRRATIVGFQGRLLAALFIGTCNPRRTT